jgi:hypothetical protein
LRNLHDTDPIFWDELTLKDRKALVPPENVSQAEDIYDDCFNNVDDSDVPIGVITEHLIADVALQGYSIGIGGGFQAEVDTERFDDKAPGEINEVDDSNRKELGCGKHCKQPN